MIAPNHGISMAIRPLLFLNKVIFTMIAPNHGISMAIRPLLFWNKVILP